LLAEVRSVPKSEQLCTFVNEIEPNLKNISIQSVFGDIDRGVALPGGFLGTR
jgi:hypothetical protein